VLAYMIHVEVLDGGHGIRALNRPGFSGGDLV